tara:strand:+ start:20196 stop:22793 length:2598 start_codon:yes stop_codon:yes gene_type:complete
MPQTGLSFEKETNTMTKKVLDFFERVRYSYLSAKENPDEYGDAWKKTVKDVREQFDTIDDFTRELKTYLKEDTAFSDEAYNPTSRQAKELYEAIKEMRFKSDEVSDPFSKQLGDKVIATLLKDESTFAAFIHYALRSHANPLPDKAWSAVDLKPDEITRDYMGLDLEPKDIPLYIIEHYGKEDEDTRRIENKFKGAYKLLQKVYGSEYSEDKWDSLVDLDIAKSDEEKQSIDFIIPNKPMYRIFEIDDLKEVKGLTGEYIVQEKYDGMRIQLHKFNNKVTIYSYNEKDITSKCPEQVKALEKKSFNDCILDGELMLFMEDEPLHRADTIAHVFKNKKGGELRAHVFDIMVHEGKNIADETLRERHNILLYQYSQHSSQDLAFPSKKDTRIADSIKEVEEYAKEIMQLPASEGVVIKDIESTYYIGVKKNPKWIKWKKFVDLDVVVLDAKKTKSNLHSYTMGIGPVNAETARNYKTIEFEDKDYLEVGKALNTKESVKIGSIVRVKVDEVKKGKDGFKLFSAKVIEIPEVTRSDSVETLEQLASKTKKSLSAMSYSFGDKVGGMFEVTSGLQNPRGKSKKDVKKGYYITDHTHGTAEIILKEDLNGFTIYGFEGDSLMQKNALHNIDLWKEQVANIMKSKRSMFRLAIRNEILESGRDNMPFNKILDFIVDKHQGAFADLFDSDDGKLMAWMKQQEDLVYLHPNKFTAREDILEKDIEELVKKDNMGKYTIVLREDDNVDLIIDYQDERMAWTIDIEGNTDIYDLFGKSGKYPAIVSKKIGESKKVLDKGEIELGIQKDGYHEYRLDGDKFETRMHFRVVPLDEKKSWIAWTGKKQEMLEDKENPNKWNIVEDTYAVLDFPTPKKD